jgi:hypothetical protein
MKNADKDFIKNSVVLSLTKGVENKHWFFRKFQPFEKKSGWKLIGFTHRRNDIIVKRWDTVIRSTGKLGNPRKVPKYVLKNMPKVF